LEGPEAQSLKASRDSRVAGMAGVSYPPGSVFSRLSASGDISAVNIHSKLHGTSTADLCFLSLGSHFLFQVKSCIVSGTVPARFHTVLGRDDVDPSKPDGYGRTPLRLAIRHGHTAMVALLLPRSPLV